VCHDSFIFASAQTVALPFVTTGVPRLIHLNHSYVYYNSFVRVPSFIDMGQRKDCCAALCVLRRDMCAMTHSCVCGMLHI